MEIHHQWTDRQCLAVIGHKCESTTPFVWNRISHRPLVIRVRAIGHPCLTEHNCNALSSVTPTLARPAWWKMIFRSLIGTDQGSLEDEDDDDRNDQEWSSCSMTVPCFKENCHFWSYAGCWDFVIDGGWMMDGWVDELMHEWIWMDGWMDLWMDGWIDAWMDNGWVDGLRNEWMNYWCVDVCG